MASSKDLFQALADKVGLSVKDVSETPTQLRVIASVPLTRLATNDWLILVSQLLEKGEASEWKADISKQYFLRGATGKKKLVYGWRLIFQGADLPSRYDEILQVIQGSPRASRAEVMSVELPPRSFGGTVGPSGSVHVLGPR